jgi:hypothetical protein
MDRGDDLAAWPSPRTRAIGGLFDRNKEANMKRSPLSPCSRARTIHTVEFFNLVLGLKLLQEER